MVVGRDVLVRLAAGVGALLATEHIGGICYLTVVRSSASVSMPFVVSL